MPDVQTADRVVAVCVSDIHLSDKAPLFRSNEKCWYEAQERQLGELRRLSQCHGGVPILVAGDIFHRWNPSPRLINFAITHMPHCYAVPGQHDLRHHNLDDLKDTAYWTLCEVGVVTDLKRACPRAVGHTVLWGFPWGIEPFPRPQYATLEGIHVAVVHRYVWTAKCSFPGAPEDNRLKATREKLKGYDVAVFGDNHLGFVSHQEGECTVINCGGFYKRNSDQRDYRPMAGVIHESGKVKSFYFDTSKDVYLPVEECPVSSPGADFEEFLEGLSELQSRSVDFRESVYQQCKARGASEGVLKHVRKAMGDV